MPSIEPRRESYWFSRKAAQSRDQYYKSAHTAFRCSCHRSTARHEQLDGPGGRTPCTKDSTDFEKTLKYCIKKKIKEVTVFGATGMRPDHTLNNFSIIKRYYKKINICLITDDFAVFYLPKRFSFNYKSGETVSFIPMPLATEIKTKGLEFSLNKETLEFGKREGALNRSNSDKVSISFKEGDLLIFRKHFLV